MVISISSPARPMKSPACHIKLYITSPYYQNKLIY